MQTRSVPIIGLVGSHRAANGLFSSKAGKDLACEYLIHCLSLDGLTGIRLAFADELKLEVAKAFGVTVEYINQNKEKFRVLLQQWGTEIRRNLFGKDYWLRKIIRRMALKNNTVYVITDLRFENEFQFVKQNGGIVVSVYRLSNLVVDASSAHSSETFIPSSYDGEIYNIGTEMDLFYETKKFIDRNYHERVFEYDGRPWPTLPWESLPNCPGDESVGQTSNSPA